MRETLSFLACGGLEALLRRDELPQIPPMTYQDFSDLRPRYAESSWRVTLGKLAQRRLVLKTSFQGKVAFQLTRQGWREFGTLSEALFRPKGGDWTLAILAPIPGQISGFPEAKRLLRKAGYTIINSSLAFLPRDEYSDYLSQQLIGAGVQTAFIRFSPGEVKPSGFADLLIDSEGHSRKSRELEKISKDIEILLTQLSSKKTLKNQTKEKIGGIILSGLSFIFALNLLDLEVFEREQKITRLMGSLDSLMREYSEINYAWRA